MARIDDIVGLFGGSVVYRTPEAAMRWCEYISIEDVQEYHENGVLIGYY